ncbi:hypothetical protein CS063_10545 [Sporanaerobium hydrogeniformans]|uniref:Uncharacterized protein n=1 Tax=Sporanaerobium hydrogeniformans TaxID=3072179 RepID=A0AC61DCI0_9FIRM|nr:EFR1 family ferrodoxin [Sporanaerobium hydrogeniformans]PHV70322.1 hypothetical protein CS063_10545 [Sporanaerobium hydrogeniformans]
MIFYFSGTGNSKWVAEQLAKKTNDKARDMMSTNQDSLTKEEVIGIVFPIYAWSPPEPVIDFVKTLQASGKFTFGIGTCADEAGLAMEQLQKHFPLNSSYSIKMPNNYIIASNVESDEVIKGKIKKAEVQLDLIAEEIRSRKSVSRITKGKMATLKSSVIAFGFNKFGRTTKPFKVTDACVGCSQCATTCPAKTIEMIDGKPKWQENCYQCLKCIHTCPAQAIEYGKGTVGRKRYDLERYL